MGELITSSGISLDLKERIPIPLNLSIADFKEPEKRQRNFSKEIDLPGTALNQKFFGSAFNLTRVQGVFDFNSSAKVNATYSIRGVPVLRNAVIKLNKVVISDGKPIFKIGLFADFVDIFLLLSKIDVRELDWSAYNHSLTNTNIENSWATPLGTGYYYPLIERNLRITLTKWKVTDLIPYLHLMDIFNKCMDLVGQKFTSVTLGTNQAKSILYGYGGGNYVDNAISATEQNNRKVLTNNGTINFTETQNVGREDDPLDNTVDSTLYFQQLSLSNPLLSTGAPILTLNETQDVYGQFLPNTFTASRTGRYKISFIGSFRIRFTGSFIYQSGGGGTLFLLKNGVSTPFIVMNQTSSDQTFSLNLSTNLDLNQGDEVKFVLSSCTLTFTNAPAESNISKALTTPTPIQINFESLDTSLVAGSIVEMAKLLPSMKCSDLVLGVIRLFNLVISDPDINGVVRMESPDRFYQPTNSFTDITEEVDHSREIEIRPSANEYAKNLKYSWKTGTETDAKFYLDKFGTAYGNLSFDQSSFFAKGEQKMELPFGTIIPYEIYGSVIVPRFVDIDSAGVKKTTAGVPRIMFRNGLKNGSWSLSGTSETSYSTFPAVHHFDNYQNPVFDLNFKLVDEVYYGTNIVTTNNTYSVYYERSVKEIISSEGKYIQLYRRINSIQAYNLDWSKLLMWNGGLYKFNKIIDFDSEITEVTKIEMIKVLEANSSNRGRTAVTSRKLTPIYKKKRVSANNEVSTGVIVISGGMDNQTLALKKSIRG